MQIVDPTKTNFSEKFVQDLLNALQVPAVKNNLNKETEVDLIVSQSIQVDVQYSEDFGKYGDLRVDLVSADKPKFNKERIPSQIQSFEQLFKAYEIKFRRQIIKRGKHFLPNYVDYIIVLFYNNTLPGYQLKQNISPLQQIDLHPDHLLIIHSSDLLDFIKKNLQYYFQQIRLNDKSGLSDRFGSAFIPIPVKHLAQLPSYLYFEKFSIDWKSDV